MRERRLAVMINMDTECGTNYPSVGARIKAGIVWFIIGFICTAIITWVIAGIVMFFIK